MTSFSGVPFVFVLLRFLLYAFVEAAALRSIVLRYAGAPIATRVFFFFFFLRCRFFRVFFVPFPLSLYYTVYGECVVRSFLLNGVFLPCDHGLDFFTSAYYVRIQFSNIILLIPQSPYIGVLKFIPVSKGLLL